MAILEVVTGSCPGQIVPLQGDRMVLGRHPTCHIVIDNAAVSRNHAQILENHGSFYIEDLRSRNGTMVNGQKIAGRQELKDKDEIRVCEMAFQFRTGTVSDLQSSTVVTMPGNKDALQNPRAQTIGEEELRELHKRLFPTPKPVLSDDLSDSSSIISMLDVANARHPRLTVRPEAKLRAVLEISKTLSKALDLSEVLPRLLEGLFVVFPQADRGFVVLKDAEAEELHVEASRFRQDDSEPPRLSSTIIHEAMKSARAILSADARSQFDKSESLHGLKICSVMCAPLVDHAGESLGVIQLDTRDTRHQFSQDDLDVLAAVGAQAVLAVENARLYEGAMKQRDLERELEFANQVQLGFLPTERPSLPGYEFADFYEAAYRVSGDFFDYVPLPDGRLALGVGDVAGKGVPAALLMARLYASARYELLSCPGPAKALESLNNVLVAGGMGHRFVTAVFVILDPKTHNLTIVNAGHLPPLRRKANGTVERLGEKESGLPLGVKPDADYEELTVPIQPGEAVLIFTDGVTEAVNPANEMYGNQRLTKFLEQPFTDAEDLADKLVTDIEVFCKDRPQRDDICLLVFRRLP